MTLFCTGSGAVLQALWRAQYVLLRTLPAFVMAALLDALRWPNFTQAEEDSTQMGTEGRAGIPRFNGEPTRLAEYTFRVRAKQAKEQAMAYDEKKELGPLGLRLIEGLSGTAPRIAQTMGVSELMQQASGWCGQVDGSL